MPKIKEVLTRKVGPLPVYAWAGVVVAGAYIGRKVLSRAGSGAPSASISGSRDLAETGFGESALPVDVTGRAPDVMTIPESDFGDFLPIPEPIFFSDGGGFDGFEPPPTPAPTSVPGTGGGILTVTKPCTKQHLPPGLGRYPNAPNRECPHGYHLNRIPLTPCFGWCVPN